MGTLRRLITMVCPAIVKTLKGYEMILAMILLMFVLATPAAPTEDTAPSAIDDVVPELSSLIEQDAAGGDEAQTGGKAKAGCVEARHPCGHGYGECCDGLNCFPGTPTELG